MTTKITFQGIEELKKQALTGNDENAILVLADALQSQGDPRGEFFVLNYQLEKNAHKLSPKEKSNYQQERKRVLQQLFKIESLEKRFRLRNILHDGDLYVVDWSKELLEDGEHLRQEEWLRETKNSLWKVPSAPLYYSSLLALHEASDIINQESMSYKTEVENYCQTIYPEYFDPAVIQECRQMHRDDFRLRRMMTSTKLIYAPNESVLALDSVIHNSKYGGSFSFVGPNGYLDDETLSLNYKMKYILGTDDCQEIITVFHNLSARFPYLLRCYARSNAYSGYPLSLVTLPSLDHLYIDTYNDTTGNVRGIIARKALEFNEEENDQ
ncbi:MAG: hypothetical protein Q8R37_01970 [Nanoarchaeota archaeon]|nr:hypothetical protein [Nanoarchaeota archaeon]